MSTTDIPTMHSLNASMLPILRRIEELHGPITRSNDEEILSLQHSKDQELTRELISQLILSLSTTPVVPSGKRWSIPGIIELVQDPDCIIPKVRLRFFLLLTIQCGQIFKHGHLGTNLGNLAPFDQVLVLLDTVKDHMQQEIRNVAAKAETLIDEVCFRTLFHPSSRNSPKEYCRIYLCMSLRKKWPFDIVDDNNESVRQAWLLSWSWEWDSVRLLLKVCGTRDIVPTRLSFQDIVDQQAREVNQSITVRVRLSDPHPTTSYNGNLPPRSRHDSQSTVFCDTDDSGDGENQEQTTNYEGDTEPLED